MCLSVNIGGPLISPPIFLSTFCNVKLKWRTCRVYQGSTMNVPRPGAERPLQ